MEFLNDMLFSKSVDSRRCTFPPQSRFASPIAYSPRKITFVEEQANMTLQPTMDVMTIARFDILSDHLIRLREEHGYPTCFDIDKNTVIVGTSFGHILVFNMPHQSLMSIITWDTLKLTEIGLVGLNICTCVKILNNSRECCVGFANGHIGLCSYRKPSGNIELLSQVHQTAVIHLLRLSESNLSFLSHDIEGKVYLTIKNHHQHVKSKCIASGKNPNNRVLGMAMCPHRMSRLIAFVYPNRVSLWSVCFAD
jgi:hypothetical protein